MIPKATTFTSGNSVISILGHSSRARGAEPFRLAAGRTTSRRMIKEMLDGSNVSSMLDLMNERDELTNSSRFKNIDLSYISFEQLQEVVITAAQTNSSLEGCGVPEGVADALIRLIELHSQRYPAEEASLKKTLLDLHVIEAQREIQLSAPGSGLAPQACDRRVLFRQCVNTQPIPDGQQFVVSIPGLQTCTGVVILTKDASSNRILTAAHLAECASLQSEVDEHHSPLSPELDHEIFIVTAGMDISEEEGQVEWGIVKQNIRNGYEMGDLTTQGPCIPANSLVIGPSWFAHAKTTLLLYPEDQRVKAGGATFTIQVPADATQPVKFFLALSDGH